MTAILAVRDLEKTFGSLVAARDITVDVPAEQTVGIIGANGAGKTTFINMITGHLRPSKGTIRFEEHDITGRPSREITRLGISRSFQVAQIFPSLTVFENMCAAAAIARSRGGTLGACADAAAFAGDASRKPKPRSNCSASRPIATCRAATLPQGVRKLLDIAMAVVGSPRVAAARRADQRHLDRGEIRSDGRRDVGAQEPADSPCCSSSTTWRSSRASPTACSPSTTAP